MHLRPSLKQVMLVHVRVRIRTEVGRGAAVLFVFAHMIIPDFICRSSCHCSKSKAVFTQSTFLAAFRPTRVSVDSANTIYRHSELSAHEAFERADFDLFTHRKISAASV